MRCAPSGYADMRRAAVIGSMLCAVIDGGSVQAQSLAPGAGSDLTASVGGAFWHGDFGAATDTSISSILFGARYRTDGLRLTASLPRMRISSDGTIFAGIGGTPLFVAPQVRSVRRVRKGLGDLTLGAAYLLPQSPAGVEIELNGRVKLPTASKSSELSTRKVDYSAGVDVSKAFGAIIPAISATYRVFGDNREWQFRNGFDITAGATYLLGRTALLAHYELTEPSSRFIGDAHEIVVGVSTPVAQQFRLTGYGSKGLSRGASDVAGGVSISVVL